MNALELADELEIVKNKIIGKEHELGGRAIIFYTEAATVLRQQQEQIDKLTAIVALLELKIERMIEDRSKYEALAHAGGFEAGYQAAKAKTLTDEEILQVHYQMMKDSNWQLPPYVEFARAILKKASEK